MISQINRILQPEQLAEVLNVLFLNRPVRILRTIARTGKYSQSVPWVYYECEITGNRRSTFIAIANILEAFWAWLENANLMLMAHYEIQAVNRAIWAAIARGTWVYTTDGIKAQVVEKDISKDGKWRLWIRFNGIASAILPMQVSAII